MLSVIVILSVILLSVIMLIVIMLSVVMLIVVMLSVDMLIVVPPKSPTVKLWQFQMSVDSKFSMSKFKIKLRDPVYKTVTKAWTEREEIVSE
jgi:hypothetical protein